MWSWVSCLRDDPGISFLDREAKGLAFRSHRHALRSSVSVKINPRAFASELDFCTALRELSNTEKIRFDVTLHEGV